MSVHVVTGASSGIGSAIARDLAAPGITLVLHGRNGQALAEVARDVETAGATSHVVTADLGDPGSLARFAQAVTDAVGPSIDGLIHSAGVARLGRIDAIPAEALDAQWAINVRAPILLTQALLPQLRAAEGRVIFINSGAGLNARAGWGGYAASKFALRAVADALREEEREHGVRVTSVYPGRVATPMQRSVREQEGGAYEASDYLPPEDVARVVVDVVRLPKSASVPDVSVRPS